MEASIDFYTKMIKSNNRTSKMFGVLPMIYLSNLMGVSLYLVMVILSLYLDILFSFPYFITSIISLLLIFEHRRLSIMKESIIELCITDEIYRKSELNTSSDFLRDINESVDIIECDREDIFIDNLDYCNSSSKINYIKKHYKFLFSIVFFQIVFYFLVMQHYTS